MFMEKLNLRLEIIGYSRAIGAMVGQPGITAAHVKGLYEARAVSEAKLRELKEQAKEQRFGKTANA